MHFLYLSLACIAATLCSSPSSSPSDTPPLHHSVFCAAYLFLSSSISQSSKSSLLTIPGLSSLDVHGSVMHFALFLVLLLASLLLFRFLLCRANLQGRSFSGTLSPLSVVSFSDPPTALIAAYIAL